MLITGIPNRGASGDVCGDRCNWSELRTVYFLAIASDQERQDQALACRLVDRADHPHLSEV